MRLVNVKTPDWAVRQPQTFSSQAGAKVAVCNGFNRLQAVDFAHAHSNDLRLSRSLATIPASDEILMNTTQKLVVFESAQFALSVMVAARSAWIYQERQKEQPDLGKIERWQKEKAAFDKERDNLSFDDTDKSQQTIDKYAPQSR
ncbi:MAG: hypothetical protein LBE75_02630 [Burkholderiales bacterium]|jgi:hypothetical protein|nr:hypothetical protein [Burkholderiales bacterium]